MAENNQSTKCSSCKQVFIVEDKGQLAENWECSKCKGGDMLNETALLLE